MRKFSKKKIDITPKNEVKQMFRSWFKKRNEAGQIMTKQDVINNILKNLNKEQDKFLEEAMDEMVSEGLIEVQEDGVTLVLKRKVK
jgi:(p)ppGpp synthase/HD superfamily hydrolase